MGSSQTWVGDCYCFNLHELTPENQGKIEGASFLGCDLYTGEYGMMVDTVWTDYPLRTTLGPLLLRTSGTVARSRRRRSTDNRRYSVIQGP